MNFRTNITAKPTAIRKIAALVMPVRGEVLLNSIRTAMPITMSVRIDGPPYPVAVAVLVFLPIDISPMRAGRI